MRPISEMELRLVPHDCLGVCQYILLEGYAKSSLDGCINHERLQYTGGGGGDS
jgi:hypothetical protein